MKVSKFSKDGKLFLKAFSIDATKNVNGWKVTSASIPKNIKSGIGAPLVLDQNYDHPEWLDGKSLIDNARYQERFRIGTITDVQEKDGVWDAIVEVTDPLAKEAIEKEEIPFYVSPRLLYNPDTQNPENLEEWVLFHLAVVDKPAFGSKAAFKGLCYGDGEQCKVALASAKTEENCGFCVKTALLKLVNNNQSSSSSQSALNTEKQLVMSASTQTIDASKFVSIEDYNALKAQVDAFKSVAEQARAAADAKIAAFEEERRTEKIRSLVTAKIADAKKAEETVKKFVDAKVAPEIVAEAMSLIPDSKRDNSENFVNNKPADAKTNSGKWFSSVSNGYGLIKGVSA